MSKASRQPHLATLSTYLQPLPASRNDFPHALCPVIVSQCVPGCFVQRLGRLGVFQMPCGVQITCLDIMWQPFALLAVAHALSTICALPGLPVFVNQLIVCPPVSSTEVAPVFPAMIWIIEMDQLPDNLRDVNATMREAMQCMNAAPSLTLMPAVVCTASTPRKRLLLFTSGRGCHRRGRTHYFCSGP